MSFNIITLQYFATAPIRNVLHCSILTTHHWRIHWPVACTT